MRRCTLGHCYGTHHAARSDTGTGGSGRRLTISPFTALLAACVCACSGAEPTEQDLPLPERLQTALEHALADYDGKGVSAAVVVDGELRWRGTATVEGASPISPDDLFWIASITKMFTAVVTLQLIEEGVLHFDDRLDQFLPPYEHVNGGITIRQLLNHTAGVYDFPNHPAYDDMMAEDRNKCWAPEEIITRLLQPPYFDPGEGWRYSSGNYVLLGMVIAQVAGHSLAGEYRTRIYEPLNLQHTFLECEDAISGPFANVWIDVDDDDIPDEVAVLSLERYSETSTAYAAGGLFSTARDVATFTDALFGRKVLLSQAMLDAMLDFFTDLPADYGWQGSGMGVSVFRSAMVNGAYAYGSGGWGAVVLSATAHMPAYRTSITTLTNALNWPFWEGVMRALSTVVMDDARQ